MEEKTVFNATQVVKRVNQLLEEGRKMKVFGLPYPPYCEDIVFTDTNVNRQGWICTNSKVVLSVVASATKIKIHTITGWCNLFKYADNGKWEDTISKDGKYIKLDVMDDICPGMLLGFSDGTNIANLGIIYDVFDYLDELEKLSNRDIVVINKEFNNKTYSFNREPSQFFVYDRIL